MKHTKHKLLSSIATLFVCFAMFIGSTYAWFTDSASTGVNNIQAGNLDIVLEYYDGTTWTGVDSNTKLFDDTALWEPGHTEVAYLHIKNAGTLDLKYKMNVNIPSETGSINQKGDAFKLSDYLVFGKIPMASATSFYAKDADGRAAAREAAGTTMGLSSWTKAGNLYAAPAPSGSVNEEYVALVIYMPETVGNEANYKKDATVPNIQLGVNIVATQLNSESDSFGQDYDENADGNPDNGAAWTMAAFRAVADVPADLSSGMTIAKYENDNQSGTKLAEVIIPATTATNASLTISDKVALSITPKGLPSTVSVGSDQAAFNYDIKLKKVSSRNVESDIASSDYPVTVELNVGKGLTGVKIYHTPSGGTTTEVTPVSYDPSTGIASFSTTSFSDYTVVYNAKLTALNAVVVTDVPSLRKALKDGAPYIALGNDIDLSNWGQSDSATAKLNGEPAIFDLNGYTIKGQISSGDILCTANETNLTLVDSSEDKTGKIISNFSICEGNTTHLDGKECGYGHEILQMYALNAWQHAITINGGTYLSNYVAVNCQVQNTSRPEGIIINDGYFGGTSENTYGASIPAGGCVNAEIGTITINGGTFKAAQYGSVIIADSGDSNTDTVFNIYGGTFEGACMFDLYVGSSKVIVNVYGGDFTVKNPDSSDTTISATSFAYDNDTHAALVNNEKVELNIMGGTFNYDPSAYVATGYNVVANSNGTWTVVAK